jgi:hypothetical protein
VFIQSKIHNRARPYATCTGDVAMMSLF